MRKRLAERSASLWSQEGREGAKAHPSREREMSASRTSGGAARGMEKYFSEMCAPPSHSPLPPLPRLGIFTYHAPNFTSRRPLSVLPLAPVAGRGWIRIALVRNARTYAQSRRASPPPGAVKRTTNAFAIEINTLCATTRMRGSVFMKACIDGIEKPCVFTRFASRMSEGWRTERLRTGKFSIPPAAVIEFRICVTTTTYACKHAQIHAKIRILVWILHQLASFSSEIGANGICTN
jgi:hypothetical protein